jgi:uncharacterized protein (DUF4213/DUF364 family)
MFFTLGYGIGTIAGVKIYGDIKYNVYYTPEEIEILNERFGRAYTYDLKVI